MNSLFVSDKSLNAFWAEDLKKAEGVDLLAFGFNGLPLVSYKKELEGKTEYFSDLSRLSKQLGAVIVSGCDTDTYGVYRHSAVIADKGRILGVSDMVNVVDDSEFTGGGGFRVYDTSAGKIGLIVGEDIFFPEILKTLSICESDIIISVYRKIVNSIPQIMLRAGAFANGVITCMIADDYVQVADINGEMLFAGKGVKRLDLKIKKDYHIITAKKRGLTDLFKGDF